MIDEMFFTDGEIRSDVAKLLELEETEDKFGYSIGRRRLFQSIVTQGVELYIEQRKREDAE